MKDLYKILGVAENADDATIKKAYRKLAKQYHPDVTGDDKKKTERFKEINEAYDVLGDKEKRAEYERLKNAPVRPDGMPEGFDAETFARTFGGARGGRGGGVSFSGDGDLGDLFASLFGDGRGRRRVQRPRARAARCAAPTSSGTLPVTLRRGGARHAPHRPRGRRLDGRGLGAARRRHAAGACACRDRVRPRPAGAARPATSISTSTVRTRSAPAPQRRRTSSWLGPGHVSARRRSAPRSRCRPSRGRSR